MRKSRLQLTQRLQRSASSPNGRRQLPQKECSAGSNPAWRTNFHLKSQRPLSLAAKSSAPTPRDPGFESLRRLCVHSSAGESVCTTSRRPAVQLREDAPEIPSLAQQQSTRPISERPRGGTWRKDQFARRDVHASQNRRVDPEPSTRMERERAFNPSASGSKPPGSASPLTWTSNRSGRTERALDPLAQSPPQVQILPGPPVPLPTYSA